MEQKHYDITFLDIYEGVASIHGPESDPLIQKILEQERIKMKVVYILEDYIKFYGEERGRKEWDKYHRQSMKISDKEIHSPTDGTSLRST